MDPKYGLSVYWENHPLLHICKRLTFDLCLEKNMQLNLSLNLGSLHFLQGWFFTKPTLS